MYDIEILKRKQRNEDAEMDYLFNLYEHRLHGEYLDMVKTLAPSHTLGPLKLPPLIQRIIVADSENEDDIRGIDLHEVSVSTHRSFENSSQECKLSLLSCIEGLVAPIEIAVQSASITIGTSIVADHVIRVSDANIGCRLAQIHCILESQYTDSKELQVYIFDNHTSWGTAVICQKGIVKALPKKISGHLLRSGDIVCIGAVNDIDSYQKLQPKDVLDACIIYRVHYRLKTVIP